MNPQAPIAAHSAPATPASAPKASALNQKIAADLDRQRNSGPLNQITIPPCPQLLLRLKAALAEAEPDLQEISRVANSDVAMAATLLRNANSARYAADQPVRTVGQAMNRLGLEVTATVLTEVLLRQAFRADHPRLKRFWEQSAQRAAAMHFLVRQREGLPADHDWRQHARAALDWLGITEDLVADWNHELQAVLDEA